MSVVLLGTKKTNAHTHGGPYGYIYIYNSYYNIVIILVGFPINIDDRVRFYEPNSSCFNPIPVVLLGTKRTNAWTHVGTIISHRIIPTL